MIYIFDDRFERKEAYSYIVNKYHKYISFETIDQATIDEFESFITERLMTPTLFLLHASYRFAGEELNNTRVIETLCSWEIPIVQFSGQFNQPSIRTLGKNKIYEVNSITMYSNLELFIKHIINDSKSTIEILLWGRDYLVNQIVATQSEIARFMCKTRLSSNVDDHIIDTLRAIIINRFRNEELQSLRKNIGRVLDDVTPSMSVIQLIQEIQKEFSSYIIN